MTDYVDQPFTVRADPASGVICTESFSTTGEALAAADAMVSSGIGVSKARVLRAGLYTGWSVTVAGRAFNPSAMIASARANGRRYAAGGV